MARVFVPVIVLIAVLTFVVWASLVLWTAGSTALSLPSRCLSSLVPVLWGWLLLPLSWWVSAVAPKKASWCAMPRRWRLQAMSIPWSWIRRGRSPRASQEGHSLVLRRRECLPRHHLGRPRRALITPLGWGDRSCAQRIYAGSSRAHELPRRGGAWAGRCRRWGDLSCRSACLRRRTLGGHSVPKPEGLRGRRALGSYVQPLCP